MLCHLVYLTFSTWLGLRSSNLRQMVAVPHIPMTSSIVDEMNRSVLLFYHHEHSPRQIQVLSLQNHASISASSPRRILILLGLQPEVLVLVVSEARLWKISR